MPAPDANKRKQMGMPSVRTSVLPQQLIQEGFTPAEITPETAGLERGGMSYEGKAYQVDNPSTTWKSLDKLVRAGNKAAEISKKVKVKGAQDERSNIERVVADLQRGDEVLEEVVVESEVIDEATGEPSLDKEGKPVMQSMLTEDGDPIFEVDEAGETIFRTKVDDDGKIVYEANDASTVWEAVKNMTTDYEDLNGTWLAKLQALLFDGSEKERLREVTKIFNEGESSMTLAEQREYWGNVSVRDSDQYIIDDQMQLIHDKEVDAQQKKAEVSIAQDIRSVFPILDEHLTHNDRMDWVAEQEQIIVAAEESGGVVGEGMKLGVSGLSAALSNGNINSEHIGQWVDEEVDRRFSDLDGSYTNNLSTRSMNSLKLRLKQELVTELRRMGKVNDKLNAERERRLVTDLSTQARDKSDISDAVTFLAASAANSPMSPTEAQDLTISAITTGMSNIVSRRTDIQWQSELDAFSKQFPTILKPDAAGHVEDSVENRAILVQAEMSSLVHSMYLKALDDPDGPEMLWLRRMGAEIDDQNIIRLPQEFAWSVLRQTRHIQDLAIVSWVESIENKIISAEEGGDLGELIEIAIPMMTQKQRDEDVLTHFDDPELRDKADEALTNVVRGFATAIDETLDREIINAVSAAMKKRADATAEDIVTDVASVIMPRLNGLYAKSDMPPELIGVLAKASEDVPVTIKNFVAARMSAAQSISSAISKHQSAIANFTKQQDLISDGDHGWWDALGGQTTANAPVVAALMAQNYYDENTQYGGLSVTKNFDYIARNNELFSLGDLLMQEPTITDKDGNEIENPNYETAKASVFDKRKNTYIHAGHDEESAEAAILSDVAAYKAFYDEDSEWYDNETHLRDSLSDVGRAPYPTVVDGDGQIVVRPYVDLESSSVEFEMNFVEHAGDMHSKEVRSHDKIQTVVYDRLANAINIIDTVHSTGNVISDSDMKKYRNSLALLRGVYANHGSFGEKVLMKIASTMPDSPTVRFLSLLGPLLLNNHTAQTLNGDPQVLRDSIRQIGIDYTYIRSTISQLRGGLVQKGTGTATDSVLSQAQKSSGASVDILTNLQTRGINLSLGMPPQAYGESEFSGGDITYTDWLFTQKSIWSPSTYFGVSGKPKGVDIGSGDIYQAPVSYGFAQILMNEFPDVFQDADIAQRVSVEHTGGILGEFAESDTLFINPETSTLESNFGRQTPIEPEVVSPTFFVDTIVKNSEWRLPIAVDPDDIWLGTDSLIDPVTYLREIGQNDLQIFERWINDYVLTDAAARERFEDILTLVKVLRMSGMHENNPFAGKNGLANFFLALYTSNDLNGMVAPSSTGFNDRIPMIKYVTGETDDREYIASDQRFGSTRLLQNEHHNLTIKIGPSTHVEGWDYSTGSFPIGSGRTSGGTLRGVNVPGWRYFDGKIDGRHTMGEIRIWRPGHGTQVKPENWSYYNLKGALAIATPFDPSRISVRDHQNGLNYLYLTTEPWINKANYGDLGVGSTSQERSRDQEVHQTASVIISGLVRDFQDIAGGATTPTDIEVNILNGTTPGGQEGWRSWWTLCDSTITPERLETLQEKYGVDLTRNEIVTMWAYDLLQAPVFEDYEPADFNGKHAYRNNPSRPIPQLAVTMVMNRFMLETGTGGNHQLHEPWKSGLPLNLEDYSVTYDAGIFDLEQHPFKTGETGMPHIALSYNPPGTMPENVVPIMMQTSDKFIDPSYFGFSSTGTGMAPSGTVDDFQPIRLRGNQIPAGSVSPTVVTPTKTSTTTPAPKAPIPTPIDPTPGNGKSYTAAWGHPTIWTPEQRRDYLQNSGKSEPTDDARFDAAKNGYIWTWDVASSNITNEDEWREWVSDLLEMMGYTEEDMTIPTRTWNSLSEEERQPWYNMKGEERSQWRNPGEWAQATTQATTIDVEVDDVSSEITESQMNQKTKIEFESMSLIEKQNWVLDRTGEKAEKFGYTQPQLEYYSPSNKTWMPRQFDYTHVRIKNPSKGGHYYKVEPETKESRISPSTPIDSYKLKKGETIYSIAKANDLTVKELLEANPNIKDVAEIAIGQEILIPNLDNIKITKHIKSYEGLILKPKLVEVRKKTNKKKYYTIGWGHYLNGGKRSRDNFAQAFPNKKYNDFMLGKGSITEKEADVLFQIDLESRMGEVVNLTENDNDGKPFNGLKFEGFSLNLRKHIISATYRGSWGYSEKTRELLAASKFKEAAQEFKNSDEYRNAIRDGLPGVRTRMDAVAQAILDEEKRFKKENKE